MTARMKRSVKGGKEKVNRTNIGWVINPDGSKGWSWNPVVGCLKNCTYADADGNKEPYCYARQVAKRSKCPKCRTFEPHFHRERLENTARKPSTIFIGSMCDLWGDWVPAQWIKEIRVIVQNSQHTLLTLTKNPKRYLEFDLPENMWCGVTIEGTMESLHRAEMFQYVWQQTKTFNKGFASFEPLLEDCGECFSSAFSEGVYKGIIIGPLNHKGQTVTKREWILNLTELAVEAGVPVFHKEECLKQGLLRPEEMRRELPWR